MQHGIFNNWAKTLFIVFMFTIGTVSPLSNIYQPKVYANQGGGQSNAARGLVTEVQTVISNGVFGSLSSWTVNEYDNRGRLQYKEIQSTRFSTASLFLHNYTYDNNGNQISMTIATDLDASGDIDWLSISTREFDNRGNVILELLERDTDQDGDANVSELTTNTYSDTGNLLISVYQSDGDNDQTFDSSIVTTNEYDSKGNLISSLTETDYDDNGVVDRIDQTTNENDKRGNVTFATTKTNFVDGSISIVTANFYYDTKGNLSNSEATTYSDSGSIVRTTTEEFERDRFGNILVRYKATDNGANGSIDSTVLQNSHY